MGHSTGSPDHPRPEIASKAAWKDLRKGVLPLPGGGPGVPPGQGRPRRGLPWAGRRARPDDRAAAHPTQPPCAAAANRWVRTVVVQECKFVSRCQCKHSCDDHANDWQLHQSILLQASPGRFCATPTPPQTGVSTLNLAALQGLFRHPGMHNSWSHRAAQRFYHTCLESNRGPCHIMTIPHKT